MNNETSIEDYDIIGWNDMEYAQNHIVKQGWLYKKGSLIPTWKYRHFVLTKDSFTYFSGETHSNEKGTMFINKMSTVFEMTNEGKHIFRFGVVTNDRTLELCAKTKRDRDDWISFISNTIQNKSTNHLLFDIGKSFDAKKFANERIRSLCCQSSILDTSKTENLEHYLSSANFTGNLELEFASNIHGFNLRVFYDKIKAESPILLIFRLSIGAVIGVYCETPLAPPSRDVKGNYNSFIFRLDGTSVCYFSAISGRTSILPLDRVISTGGQPFNSGIYQAQPHSNAKEYLNSSAFTYTTMQGDLDVSGARDRETSFSPFTMVEVEVDVDMLGLEDFFSTSHAEKTLLNGWLQKRGRSAWSGWRSRYFVLDAHSLVYFEDSMQQQLKGWVSIDATSEVSLLAPDDHDHTFSLTTGDRKIELCAGSADICSKWMKALQDVLIECKKELSTGVDGHISQRKTSKDFDPDLKDYSTNATLNQFAVSTQDYLSFGASKLRGSNAVRIFADLTRCSLDASDTYGNLESLIPEGGPQDFEVNEIEAFCGVLL